MRVPPQQSGTGTQLLASSQHQDKCLLESRTAQLGAHVNAVVIPTKSHISSKKCCFVFYSQLTKFQTVWSWQWNSASQVVHCMILEMVLWNVNCVDKCNAKKLTLCTITLSSQSHDWSALAVRFKAAPAPKDHPVCRQLSVNICCKALRQDCLLAIQNNNEKKFLGIKDRIWPR